MKSVKEILSSMNKKEKAALVFGILFWYVGDLITTYMGLGMGITEKNLPTQDFSYILIMKTVTMIFILSVILQLNSNEYKFNDDLKKILYTSLISFGVLATIGNSMAIMGMI